LKEKITGGTGGLAGNPCNKTAREETLSSTKLTPPLAKGEDGGAKYITCVASELWWEGDCHGLNPSTLLRADGRPWC